MILTFEGLVTCVQKISDTYIPSAFIIEEEIIKGVFIKICANGRINSATIQISIMNQMLLQYSGID